MDIFIQQIINGLERPPRLLRALAGAGTPMPRPR
jgi:hypothetical protein